MKMKIKPDRNIGLSPCYILLYFYAVNTTNVGYIIVYVVIYIILDTFCGNISYTKMTILFIFGLHLTSWRSCLKNAKQKNTSLAAIVLGVCFPPTWPSLNTDLKSRKVCYKRALAEFFTLVEVF